MKQINLSKKEIKALNLEINNMINSEDFFSIKDKLSLVNDDFITKDGKLLFFYSANKLIPSIKLLQQKNLLKHIIIDMGAVPFITKGSDLMRPGIVGISSDVEKGEIVAIKDEKNMVTLAIGKALFSKNEIEEMKAGKVILNLHHVGDKIWKMQF